MPLPSIALDASTSPIERTIECRSGRTDQSAC
jgi:hypothetical protein